MRGHPPISDTGLLLSSIFVAVALVGIGILGGQEGPEEMARIQSQMMVAGTAASPPAKQKCLPTNETNKADIRTTCVNGCHYLVRGGGFPVSATLTSTAVYSDGTNNVGTVQYLPYGTAGEASDWVPLYCKGGSGSTIGGATGSGGATGALAGLVGTQQNSLNVVQPQAPASPTTAGQLTPQTNSSYSPYCSGISVNPGGCNSWPAETGTAPAPTVGQPVNLLANSPLSGDYSGGGDVPGNGGLNQTQLGTNLAKSYNATPEGGLGDIVPNYSTPEGGLADTGNNGAVPGGENVPNAITPTAPPAPTVAAPSTETSELTPAQIAAGYTKKDGILIAPPAAPAAPPEPSALSSALNNWTGVAKCAAVAAPGPLLFLAAPFIVPACAYISR